VNLVINQLENSKMEAASPLGQQDLQGVFECLKGCLSQDIHVQKQAEAALNSLGTRPGFCSCLAVSDIH
jgi:hypothetical protein